MNIKEYKDYLVKFLKDYAINNHISGYILGVSGGVDSAVVAGLLKETELPTLCLIMPIESNPLDTEDAISVCKEFNLSYEIVDLTSTYLELRKKITLTNKLAIANIKPRLRMTTLYAKGQENGYLVVGTDNACEYYTGYFPKFGDGAYDILPLRYLVKSEVYEMAKILNVPATIINKQPTAGLMDGQTDESEMGISYKDLDNYLLGNKIDQNVVDKIETFHKKSNHKRMFAVLPEEIKRS